MIGKTISRFEITAKLGEGGMGEVYEALDLDLGRKVALKVLPRELAASADRLERFRREARMIAALDHPNIVTVYSVDEADGLHFLTMELVSGATLADLLPQVGFPPARFIELAGTIAEAVSAAHDEGIVHRDLKSTNIMVRDRDGAVKILDFGLAKSLGPIAASTLSSLPTEDLTQHGQIIGTVPYMSPEQIEGAPIDQRTDIFSLGVLFFEMLAGQRPFQGANAATLISSILRDAPPPLDRFRDDVPPTLSRVIDRCLVKRPDDRYQGGRALADDLARIRIDGRSRPDAASNRKTETAPEATDARKSIAVLPFLNRGGNPDDDYFSDGLSEELINALGNLPGIKVTARSSAFQFRGQELDVREIGQRLGVDAVLEGSVRIAGKRLRITTQLADCSDGLQLWSERFDGEMKDVFDTQDEIAQAIVEQLHLELGPRSGSALVKHGTDDLDAYHLLLRARHHMSSFWEPGLVAAIECLEQAVDRDPDYAEAYGLMAECYIVRANFGSLPGREAFPKCHSAIRRALDLDPGLGPAHAFHGVYLAWHDFDWQAADRELATAIELSPQNVWNHLYSAAVYATARRSDEILASYQRARELDPLNPLIQAHAILFSFYANQPEIAAVEAKKTRELFPDFWLVDYFEAVVRWQLRDAEAATRLIEGVLAVTGDDAPYLACYAAAIHFFFDNPDRGLHWLAEVDRMSETRTVSPTGRALIEIARGRGIDAIHQLEKARQDKDAPFAWCRAISERLDILSDDCVRQAMARLGLP
jgi:serine/threonine protein kinase/tetratricopeptide (TPR) repeat protein